MRWLYKIWGGFDGFTPRAIPGRLRDDELELGWAKYADVAEPGDEVWVWFHQGQRFTPGVYAKGIVKTVDPLARQVVLTTREWNSATPLTTFAENALLAPIVAPRQRQVFFLPEDFRRFENCSASAPGAPSCAGRQCDYCTHWAKLPVILRTHVRTPPVLQGHVKAFAPGYWVIGRRSFVWSSRRRQKEGIRATTDLFYRFKTGEVGLTYPLVKGMIEALAKRNCLTADAVVPIPLSPEKIAAGEVNRTLRLAEVLGNLLGVPMVNALSLNTQMGKRVALSLGQSPAVFRRQYEAALEVDTPRLTGLDTIILVDDVCTYGHTTRATISALRRAGVTADIIVSTAGQMTIRSAVLNERAVFKMPRQASGS